MSVSRHMGLRRGTLIAAVAVVAVLGAGTGRVAATTPHTYASRATAAAATRSTAAQPHVAFGGRVKHVVVIYQENHSFDETLGWFCQQHPGRCDGYVGPVQLSDGTIVAMRPSPDMVPGVAHTVAAQTAAIDDGKMDGWGNVGGCSAVTRYACLTYYTDRRIGNLLALASKFVVSDRTFSLANSPSWGGHVYAAAATQDSFTGDLPTRESGVRIAGPGWGCNSHLVAPWIDPTTHVLSMQPSCIPAKPGTLNAKTHPYNGAFRPTPAKYVPTIFDRLDAKHLSWKLYSSVSEWSICPSFAECEYTKQHLNVVKPARILSDADHGRLPTYSVLLPVGPGGTSQHNAASMVAGDNWIGQVVRHLERSPNWSSTAIFITYDDCGCFYDHVPPGTNPDGTTQGIRVPMVIVSPYARVGYTDSNPATFASILRFTEAAFGLAPLGVNDRAAYDYSDSFNFAAKPSGPRVASSRQPIPAASRRYLAAHPDTAADPT
jgi:phospholipase C